MILAIFLILPAEGFLVAGYPALGASVQALNIIAVVFIAVALRGERVQLVEAVALISVFEVVSSSLVHVSIIDSLAIVCVMYLSLILVIPTASGYSQVAVYGVMIHPDHSDRCTPKAEPPRPWARRRSPIDDLIPFGTLIGVGLGLIEYAILGNNQSNPNVSASELIQLSIVMVFFVGAR
ncbi:MAG: hypothetical protein ACXVIL_11240 [Halobacteriota archaeon]